MRLISACACGRRNRRGRGLPGCGRGVTVPTSMKPKPSRASASMCSPFLSRPAARPTAVGERRGPSTRTGRRLPVRAQDSRRCAASSRAKVTAVSASPGRAGTAPPAPAPRSLRIVGTAAPGVPDRLSDLRPHRPAPAPAAGRAACARMPRARRPVAPAARRPALRGRRPAIGARWSARAPAPDRAAGRAAPPPGRGPSAAPRAAENSSPVSRMRIALPQPSSCTRRTVAPPIG